MKGKKVCKVCKVFIEGDKCQNCQGTEFVETWKGRIIVMNPESSEIAKNLKIAKKGDYAIKTR